MVEAIASVVTMLGVLLLIPQLRQSQRQRHRQFEDLFLSRYWVLLDAVPASCDLLAQQDSELPAVLNADDRRWVMKYLRLCEDQCEMRAAGWVTDETWKMWWAGMSSQITKDPYRHLIELSVQGGAFTFLDGSFTLEVPSDYDPLAMPSVGRFWRGLVGFGDFWSRRSLTDLSQTTTAAAD